MSVAFGMAVMQAMFDVEIAAACGPKGRDAAWPGDRFGGAGRPTMDTVAVTRPRARTMDGHEVPLASYGMFAGEDRLTAVVMERMLAGLATRRHVAAAEPVGAQVQQAARRRAGRRSRAGSSRRPELRWPNC